ncbi:thiol-disulfide oxidoreductase DCC family protein [Halobaculum sp. MBLA0143]|uniref:thiol-disulfide oxidoreductase DCC family protein n=1 Tax=Halobaculum sp. MBLA0143 TaxID=3079933 RepID=UPI00352672A2
MNDETASDGGEPDASGVDADTVLSTVDGPILLFDGVCNLCNRTVRFVVDHDGDGRVSFAPLQSPVGEALLERVGLPTETMDSVVLIEGERVSRKSDAALRVTRYLDDPLPAARLFELVPAPLRDAGYDMVAEHRYRVFGRKESCPVPDAETRERFLDGSFD